MTTVAFEQTAHRWLGTFQQDLKDFLHVVCDDPELDDTLRKAAAGAVLYALAPGDVVPDSTGPLGYVDDALALRIVLGEVAQKAPGRFASYRDRLAEMTGTLDADLQAAQLFLDDAYELFRARILDPTRIEFKGKRVADVLADPDWLDDEVSVAALKLDFKPADLQTAVKRVATLLPLFRQKLLPRK
jgi:uncharacterized membrane protein YkvA (DUF1232 family)